MSAVRPTGRMLEARGKYRRLLADDDYLSKLTLAGLAPDDEPILLRDIYVPLLLGEKKVAEQSKDAEIERAGRLLEEHLPAEPEAGRGRLLFLSGEPGSGKTTGAHVSRARPCSQTTVGSRRVAT